MLHVAGDVCQNNSIEHQNYNNYYIHIELINSEHEIKVEKCSGTCYVTLKNMIRNTVALYFGLNTSEICIGH